MKICYTHEFAAAHRIFGHRGKCKNLHGHNYKVKMVLETEPLNTLGMVMDFAEAKDLFGGWIDQNWDHKLLLFCKDPITEQDWLREHGLVVLAFNPTAENMAQFLFEKFNKIIEEGNWQGKITAITVFETEKGAAKCE